jgi:hypothetical protein
MKFTESQLEEVCIQLLGEQGYTYTRGNELSRAPEEVLIKGDLEGHKRLRFSETFHLKPIQSAYLKTDCPKSDGDD